MNRMQFLKSFHFFWPHTYKLKLKPLRPNVRLFLFIFWRHNLREIKSINLRVSSTPNIFCTSRTISILVQ